jgi:HK97 family phage major capsid protein
MPSVVQGADRELHSQLRNIEVEIGELREKRSLAMREREAAKERLASGRGALRADSSEFRDAQRAVERVKEIERDLDERQSAQVGLLKMLGRDAQAAPGDPAAVDVTKAGGWLAREVRKSMTTDDIGSVDDTGRVFFDRLRERSALLASGVTTIDIDTSEIRVPVLTGRITPAVPTAELDPIAEGDPPISYTTVKPYKLPKLVTLSLEAYRDARPAVLAATERELVGAIADGFDAAAFAGAAAPQVGIVNTSGIIPIDATSAWTNLDPFVSAKAALRNVGAVATAIYMHPLDYEIAALMKKGTGSNESLLSGQAPPTQAPAESLLDVPVFQSTTVPRHKAVVAQANELVVVRRSDVEVAVDEAYKFDTAGVGIRTIARLALVVAQSAAVVVISLPTS